MGVLQDMTSGLSSIYALARIQEYSWGEEGGVQVSLKKSSESFFSSPQLTLFYRSQMVNFKENDHFSRFLRGSNIFQGGGGCPTFSRGSNCLFPIVTHITCDFPGGSGPPAFPPPSGSALEAGLY